MKFCVLAIVPLVVDGSFQRKIFHMKTGLCRHHYLVYGPFYSFPSLENGWKKKQSIPILRCASLYEALVICYPWWKRKKRRRISATHSKKGVFFAFEVKGCNCPSMGLQPCYFQWYTFCFDLTPFLRGFMLFFIIPTNFISQKIFTFKINQNNSYHSWFSVWWQFFSHGSFLKTCFSTFGMWFALY